MSSPISPFLVDSVVQDLEIDIFKRIDFYILAYFHNVDIFLLIPRDKIHYILSCFTFITRDYNSHMNLEIMNVKIF